MRGALWWLRQSHSVNYANHQHSPDVSTPIFQFLAPKNYLGAYPPFGYGDANYISPLSFGKSFMKIRSAVPKNGCHGCLIFFDGRKKTKQKQKKHL